MTRTCSSRRDPVILGAGSGSTAFSCAKSATAESADDDWRSLRLFLAFFAFRLSSRSRSSAPGSGWRSSGSTLAPVPMRHSSPGSNGGQRTPRASRRATTCNSPRAPPAREPTAFTHLLAELSLLLPLVGRPTRPKAEREGGRRAQASWSKEAAATSAAGASGKRSVRPRFLQLTRLSASSTRALHARRPPSSLGLRPSRSSPLCGIL